MGSQEFHEGVKKKSFHWRTTAISNEKNYGREQENTVQKDVDLQGMFGCMARNIDGEATKISYTGSIKSWRI